MIIKEIKNLNNFIRHRDNDLPACIWSSGTQEWYQHGECHRDNDLPAIIWSSGTQSWWQHGELIK